MNRNRQEKGITLIALVITIVILIILATIGIGAIFGKNGLISRVQQAKEKAQIEAAREKLVLKLTDLQADAIEQGKKLTLEDLIIINTTEKDMKVETTTTDEEGNEIEEKVVRYKGDGEGEKDYTKVTVDGYVFKVDDDFGVTYIDARNDPEKGPGYNGGDADDELGDGGITLDEDKEHDPNADKLHDTVPEGWVGIYNETDLINMKNDLSKKYILMTDIPLSKTWTPLGDSKTEFTGYLNGNGHTITNMNISGTDGYLGMFARTSGTTYLSNLNIKNYTLTGKGKYIGGLVGYNKGNIRGVSFTGILNINGEASYVGGLVGFHRYDSKTTTGIERVYTGGTLNAPQGTCVGGIVGLMEGYSETYKDKTYIKNSYSTMTTTGNEHVGGLVGEMRYSHLENTYTIGKVTGKKNTGGVVATVNSSCYAENTYWGKGITTQKTSALGMIQTMPKLAKQASYNNYDFANVWGIDENETTAYLLGMEVPSILRKLMEGYITQQGDGSEENPYEIWTEEQLYNVRNHLDAHWIVMADLDLSEYESWTPIGTDSKPFEGNFNGNGHTIENMTIKNCGNNSGLFGYMYAGEIYDLALENYQISGSSKSSAVGGLCGAMIKGSGIAGIYAEGKINMSGASDALGGVVGYIESRDLYDSYIERCCSTGSINAPRSINVGGILGTQHHPAPLSPGLRGVFDCLSFMDLTGKENVGGIVGWTWFPYDRSCLSLGSITVPARPFTGNIRLLAV